MDQPQITDLIGAIKPPQSPQDAAIQQNQARLQQAQLNADAQEAQARQQQIQQNQRQMDQNQALDDAYKASLIVKPDGTPDVDMGKLTQAMAASGHGSAIPAIQEAATKYKQSIATLAETNGKVQEQEADAAGSLGAMLQAANNDPHLFLTAAQHAVDMKTVDGQLLQPMIAKVGQSLTQDPSGESARGIVGQIGQQLIAGSVEQQKQIAARQNSQGAMGRGNAAVLEAGVNQSKEQRAATTQQLQSVVGQLGAATDQDSWDAARTALPPALQTQVPPLFSPQAQAQALRLGMTPEQQTTADQTKIRDAAAAANQQSERTQGQGRLNVEVAAQALREKQYNATFGAGLDANGQPVIGPDGKPMVSGAAQMIANYQVAPPSSYVLARNPGLLNQVMSANPAYDAKNYDAARTIRTGQTAKNIQALNTATVHMDQLNDVAGALSNGSFKPGNAVFNAAVNMFGGAAPTNFEGLKNAVAGEMASALKGNATDIEIANIGKTISSANSPAQLAGVIKENVRVLGAKLNTYDEQYHQAVGPKDPWHPLLPTASAVLQKYNVSAKPQISGAQMHVKLSDGRTGTIPSSSFDPKTMTEIK